MSCLQTTQFSSSCGFKSFSPKLNDRTAHRMLNSCCLQQRCTHKKYSLKKQSQWKAKVYLCLISYALCHEDIWEIGFTAPLFLISALDGSEWLATRPYRFTSRGNNLRRIETNHIEHVELLWTSLIQSRRMWNHEGNSVDSKGFWLWFITESQGVLDFAHRPVF
jgi:hypothetical protein